MNDSQKAFIVMLIPEFLRFGFQRDVAEFIACQFALESNFGRSHLATLFNNYCGMRMPLVRINVVLAQDPKTGFAIYSSLFDCILDYMLCLQYHRPISSIRTSVDRFKFFIKEFYCPEKDYIDKITNLLKSYKNEQTK